MELSWSSVAPWLLCQGKAKAALIETGLPPCPETGQHERATVLQDRLTFPSERAWMQRWWYGGPNKREILWQESGRAELPWAHLRQPQVDVLPCAWRRSCRDLWREYHRPDLMGRAEIQPDAGSGTS